MKYYPHHIGDFDKATRHLTRIERSIYRDLIEIYYDTEQPLILDLDALCRKIIARSDEERTAVEQTLNEFFTKTEQGWYHSRCEDEIEKYHNVNSQKSVAGKASAAKRAAKKQQAINGNSTSVATDVELPLNGTSTNQEPRTINQEPFKEKEKKEATPSARALAHRTTALGILDYLNLKADRNLGPTDTNVKFITSRLNDGASAELCKQVIDFKVKEWKGDPKMDQHLHPETLFNASKFSKYVGQVNDAKRLPPSRPAANVPRLDSFDDIDYGQSGKLQ